MQEEEHQAKTDYADLSALICLLCQRKFKTKADLEKHQAVSELHKVRSIAMQWGDHGEGRGLCVWDFFFEKNV